MSRLPEIPYDQLSVEQRRIHDDIVGSRGGIRGPFACWLHSPELADRAQRLGAFCRFETSLPAHLKELAILVTAEHWQAQFEWWAHGPLAEKAGLDPAVIESLRRGERPEFMTAEEATVYDFARALLRERDVDDATYARAVEAFGQPGVVELAAVIGYYGLVAATLNAFRVPVPDGRYPFPKRGETR